ncbi:Trans-aconitate methyltransferase [Natronoarchaeum philippinense]|uniref:Trans-aconitate methyltransferase n=1 Tax=Natronoarchaeum philippinense TaxID=558529 RepID=A0A285NUN0_NATPI|nr:class I SAM-dependent methyltransferase [Natronoarchaeum philippinense]SNZ12727.1 Trans-aconitate methyltransferase [Natronoarchaeum philippinense]
MPNAQEPDWDPMTYEDDHAFVYEYGADVLDLLDPAPDERVLDIGCGTGALTAEIADTGADVVGIDSSQDMIERAREAHPAIEFRHADARTATFDDSFDAVFSNAALHWIDEQDAALSTVADALRPGGRFVAELGGDGNVAAIVDAALAELAERGYDADNPWYFPTVGEYASRLERHGFEVRYATLFDRPTELDGEDGLRNWLDVFGDGLFAPLSNDEREAVVRAVEDRLRADYYEDGVWTADYRRLRFRAVRE